MRYLIILFLILAMASTCFAESYLFLGQTKSVNGSFKYYLPKLELNQAKFAGKFLNTPCYYLSELEAGLVYSAPRGEMLKINHHSVEANWNLGVEVGPIWATYSLGTRYYIKGNDDGIPEGMDAFNSARLGILF